MDSRPRQLSLPPRLNLGWGQASSRAPAPAASSLLASKTWPSASSSRNGPSTALHVHPRGRAPEAFGLPVIQRPSSINDAIADVPLRRESRGAPNRQPRLRPWRYLPDAHSAHSGHSRSCRRLASMKRSERAATEPESGPSKGSLDLRNRVWMARSRRVDLHM